MLDMNCTWDNTYVQPLPKYEMFSNQASGDRFSGELNLTEVLLNYQGSEAFLARLAKQNTNDWTNSNLLLDEPLIKAENIGNFARKLKNILGMSNKDIGLLYGVTRQSVQNYLKSDDGANRASDHAIAKAVAIDKVLEQISPLLKHSPGPLVKSITANGESLFDVLANDTIDPKQAVRIADKLREIMEHSDSGIKALNEDSALSSITRHT